MSRKILLILVTFVVACASNAPRVETRLGGVDSGHEFDPAALIQYRPLTRADFQADALPRELRGLGLGAVTVVYVYATPCKIQTTTHGVANDREYEAVVTPFRYEARMNPARSWWDPNQGFKEEHFLDHEQTHFAIAEVGVRRANMEIEEIRSRIRSRAQTREEAVHMAELQFTNELHFVQGEISERNARFDEETANGQRQNRNDAWVAMISRELQSLVE